MVILVMRHNFDTGLFAETITSHKGEGSFFELDRCDHGSNCMIGECFVKR
jgi:hypothetical protein